MAKAWLSAFDDESQAAAAANAIRSPAPDSALGEVLAFWEGLHELVTVETDGRVLVLALRWAALSFPFGRTPDEIVPALQRTVREHGGGPYAESGDRSTSEAQQYLDGLDGIQGWVVEDPLTGVPALLDDPKQSGDWTARVRAPTDLELEGTFRIADPDEDRVFPGTLRGGLLRLRPPGQGFFSKLLGRKSPPPRWVKGDVVVRADGAATHLPPRPGKLVPRAEPRSPAPILWPKTATDKAKERNRERWGQDYADAEAIEALKLERDALFHRDQTKLVLGDFDQEGTLVHRIRVTAGASAPETYSFVSTAFVFERRLDDAEVTQLQGAGLTVLRAGARTVLPLEKRERDLELELNGHGFAGERAGEGYEPDLYPGVVRLRETPLPKKVGRSKDLVRSDPSVRATVDCTVDGHSGKVEIEGAWDLELRERGMKVLFFTAKHLLLNSDTDPQLEGALKDAFPIRGTTVELNDEERFELRFTYGWNGRDLSGLSPTAIEIKPA